MDSQTKVDEFLSEHKLPLLMGLVGLVLLLGGAVSSGVISKTFIKSTKSGPVQSQNASFTSVSSEVKVDVSGAVISPGVYSLPSNSRVEDAIKAAGGVAESADPVYLTKTINLAQKVTDGMKIYVPAAGETISAGQGQAGQSTTKVAGASSQVSLVNINSASLSELDQLPGVGPVGAQNIIDRRPYGSIEELLTKKAVTRSVYEKIKGLVSVF